MKTQRKVRVVVNPSAASGRAWGQLQRAGVLDTSLNRNFEWIASRSPAHFADAIAEAVHKKVDAVAVAGGDGTVAMALDTLDKTGGVPLGILPVGSGNDFAKDAGVPKDLRHAFR